LAHKGLKQFTACYLQIRTLDSIFDLVIMNGVSMLTQFSIEDGTTAYWCAIQFSSRDGRQKNSELQNSFLWLWYFYIQNLY